MTAPVLTATACLDDGEDGIGFSVTGTVNPGGLATNVWLEWSLTPGGPWTRFLDDNGPYSGSTVSAVSVREAYLDPDLSVWWRLRASNVDGTVVTPEQWCDRGSSELPGLPTGEGGFCGWKFEDQCSLDLSGSDETITHSKIAFAEQVAGDVLWALSGRQYGECRRTVRPCAQRCAHDVDIDWWDVRARRLGYRVADTSLPWPLCSCASMVDRCGCTTVEVLQLPKNTTAIEEIVVDGVVLPRSAYRLDRGGRVYRLDGGVWPVCQDFNAVPGEVGAWTVTYRRGVAVPAGGRLAGGILKCEILKALLAKPCNLPDRVQTIVRNGTSMVLLDPQDFLSEGKTGIYTVDLWLLSVNPQRQARPPKIVRADDPRRRRRV